MLIFAVFAKNYQGSYFGNSIDAKVEILIWLRHAGYQQSQKLDSRSFKKSRIKEKTL